jgi:predicted transcriptional regulator
MELPTPQQIEQRAAAARLTMTEVCQAADINRRTWERWRSGKTSMRFASVRAILDVIQDKERANGCGITSSR